MKNEEQITISALVDDSVVGERTRSAAFPPDISYGSYVGRALVTTNNAPEQVIPYDEFLSKYEESVFVRVDRVNLPLKSGGGSVFRFACLMPGGEFMETPLFSLDEARDLLDKESMRLKPALWLGHSVLITGGSLGLEELTKPLDFSPESTPESAEREGPSFQL